MKYLFSFLLAASLTQAASAQSIITFEQTERKTSSYSNETGKNALSIGLLSSFNGYLPLYYERAILDVMSLEIGAGPTFRSIGNDIGAAMYSDGLESDHFDGSYNPITNISTIDISENYSSYDARETKMGMAFSVAPKFYPGGYALDGFHLGPVVEYKTYRYNAQLADPLARGAYTTPLPTTEEDVLRATSTFAESVKCLDFTFQLGGMYQAPSHLSIGWGFSFGVRRLNAQRLDAGLIHNDFTGESQYVNEIREYSSLRPLLLFDVKFGGWF